MIANEIKISKEIILNKYSNLCSFFISSINALYEETDSSVSCVEFNDINEEIIKLNCRSNEEKKSKFCKLRGKTGVYIFIENEIPVYIGVGGIGKNDDLINRINAETRSYPTSNNATLSKNIQDIDKLLLNTHISENDSLDKIKRFKLKVLVVGDKDIDSNKDKSMALESVLIALYNAKYNK